MNKFFTAWVDLHLGRAHSLVKCDLRIQWRKTFLLQAGYSLVPLCLENIVTENLPIILLVLMSLTSNNLVLKSQTVFLYEGNNPLSPFPWISVWRLDWCAFLVWALPCSAPHHWKGPSTKCRFFSRPLGVDWARIDFQKETRAFKTARALFQSFCSYCHTHKHTLYPIVIP